MDAHLIFEDVTKTFVLHQRGTVLDVIDNASFSVRAQECAVLTGPSGAGKSTLLRLAYGNYRADGGRILTGHGDTLTDIATGDARAILKARRRTISYVSQFLSVIPRVAAEHLVAATAEAAGHKTPRAVARDTLARLNLPETLWQVPPATFSGGEQQRVNIAISFVGRHPILLLDEPTASLDAPNCEVVVELIEEKRAAGCAILAVFHDSAIRDAVATRCIDVTKFTPPTEVTA
ncbi:MAG: phosphonate C-P lyase system protein PhnL [Pseudomonadota bacterium]